MRKQSKRKLKIPKSVKDLRMSPSKFAKKNGIRLKGKGVSKRERKRNRKKLNTAYAEASINGLNRAVKILSENDPENKKIIKVKDGVENIITNPQAMKRIAKIYDKNKDSYSNMIFMPHLLMNTLLYYTSEDLTEEEKIQAESLDPRTLLEFCEKILKKQIKRYRKLGIPKSAAFELATVIPTTKLLKNRRWYHTLIGSMYSIAEKENVELDVLLSAVQRIDKKNAINKNEFYEKFFLEFVLRRSSNKKLSYNDSQKDLHDTLVESSLQYLDGLKPRKRKVIMKDYIKRRKTAESYKNDTKRVIKFIDHANSNSPYTGLRATIQELIADNSSNELYLS